MNDFKFEQIKIGKKDSLFTKNEIQNILPNEVFESIFNLQEKLLLKKKEVNPDIKDTDLVDLKENIILVTDGDLNTENPEEKVINIKIDGIKMGIFIDTYKEELRKQIELLNLKEGMEYSIYDFNQSIHFTDEGEQNSKNESGYSNLISKGNII